MLISLRYVLSYEVPQLLQRYVDFSNGSASGFNCSPCEEPTVVVPLLDKISVGISNCNGLLKVVTPFLLSGLITLISAVSIFPLFPVSSFIILANFQKHLAVPSFFKITKSPNAATGCDLYVLFLAFSLKPVKHSCLHYLVKCCGSLQ